VTLRLRDIHRLAVRYVPTVAADHRLFDHAARSWWPAHEIGHFLVATSAECREHKFGIGIDAEAGTAAHRYIVAKEIAAMSISQRLLRGAGHAEIADEEVQFTDEWTLECSFEHWCRRSVAKMMQDNRTRRLPKTVTGLAGLLARKTREVSR
jgi:hypothetical protein